MKKIIYKYWSKFLTFFGDIKIFRYPFFIVYDPDDFRMTGDKVLDMMETLEPGDVILRGYDRYLDGKFIDFFGADTSDTVIGGGWSHGAVYIGNGRIIHAVSEGVKLTDVIEFSRCDRICVFKPRKYRKSAVAAAKRFLTGNTPYDFSFKNGSSALYCFELAALCYPKLNIPAFDIRKLFGIVNKKKVFLSKSFLASPDFVLSFCFNPKYGKDL